MKVNLIQVTPEAEKQIVEIARVSSTRKDKRDDISGLINYCIKNKHWSIFEQAHMTIEIETSRAIAAQILRHRSFTFQEFSQRYQDVTKLSDDIFEPIAIRKNGSTNRQSSTESFDPLIKSVLSAGDHHLPASKEIANVRKIVTKLYKTLLAAGVAKECARFELPLATKTKIYMTGTIRSWIHFLDVRDDEHAQLEIQVIAKEIREIFNECFPDIAKALNTQAVRKAKLKLLIQALPLMEEALSKASHILKPEQLLCESEHILERKKDVEENGRKQYKKFTKTEKKAIKSDGAKLSIRELVAKYGGSYGTLRTIVQK
jgi:thymidylate synthase (FAD)